MKFRNTLILILLIVFVGLVAVSCGNDADNKKLISNVKSVYINEVLKNDEVLVDDVDVKIYHSVNDTVNAAFVSIVYRKSHISGPYEVCLDVCFPNNNGSRFYVFANNKLYSLYNAIERYVISESEFYDFVAKCDSSECKKYIDGFKPAISISDDLRDEMIQKYWEQCNLGNHDIDKDSLSVRCLGIFEKCSLAFIDGPFSYLDAITYDEIGNVVVCYSSSHTALAYKDGTYYTLPEAYDNGYFTTDELLSIRL